MVWLKNLWRSFVTSRFVTKFKKKQDPEELLNERIKKMREKDPFIYK